MNNNVWLNGMMGLIIGDALGLPVQFMSRRMIACREEGLVKGMEAGGIFGLPEGTWSDDSSMALATLDSIRKMKGIYLEDIMNRFVCWFQYGEYTPFGLAFDVGKTCAISIYSYAKNGNLRTCGRTDEHSNGNGSLMRIMPACIYVCVKNLPDNEAISVIHAVSGLTHNHIRSKIACGLYYFCVREILNGEGTLNECLQNGLDKGFSYYYGDVSTLNELQHYKRLRDLAEFEKVPEDNISSRGYVVDSLEASVWSLIKTKSFKDCLLEAVNLGHDTDTIGAIAGGLAGLYYGYECIPEDWLSKLQKRKWIEEICIMKRI